MCTHTNLWIDGKGEYTVIENVNRTVGPNMNCGFWQHGSSAVYDEQRYAPCLK